MAGFILKHKVVTYNPYTFILNSASWILRCTEYAIGHYRSGKVSQVPRIAVLFADHTKPRLVYVPPAVALYSVYYP